MKKFKIIYQNNLFTLNLFFLSFYFSPLFFLSFAFPFKLFKIKQSLMLHFINEFRS